MTLPLALPPSLPPSPSQLYKSVCGPELLARHPMSFYEAEEDDLLFAINYGVGWYSAIQFPSSSVRALPPSLLSFPPCCSFDPPSPSAFPPSLPPSFLPPSLPPSPPSPAGLDEGGADLAVFT